MGKENDNEFLVRFDFAIKNMLRDKKNFDILEGFIEVFTLTIWRGFSTVYQKPLLSS